MIRIRPKVKDIEKVNIFLKPKKYRRNTAASIQVLKLSSIKVLLRVCDFSDSSPPKIQYLDIINSLPPPLREQLNLHSPFAKAVESKATYSRESGRMRDRRFASIRTMSPSVADEFSRNKN